MKLDLVGQYLMGLGTGIVIGVMLSPAVPLSSSDFGSALLCFVGLVVQLVGLALKTHKRHRNAKEVEYAVLENGSRLKAVPSFRVKETLE